MIALIVVAAALAAAPAEPAPSAPTGVSPVVVQPAPKGGPPPAATVDVAADENTIGTFASVWPEGAYQARMAGSASLTCLIDTHGLAEWCDIASETPPGKGFGAAALTLRPTFKLAPAVGADGRPQRSMMTIAIRFNPPAPQFHDVGRPPQGAIGECGGLGPPCPDLVTVGNPLPRRSVTMLDHPVWAAAATFEDLAAAYPVRGGGVEGYAVAHCEVERGGRLDGCRLTKETPEAHGFAAAALKLAAKFRVTPEQAKVKPGTELWVDVPIRLPPPDQLSERRVEAPVWLAGFDPDQALKVFPPEAAARGLTTGRGVARCRVASDGSLGDCAPEAADPDGLGFSEAAARLAATLRMSPWTADAAPVDGASVEVAIRLNLKPG